MTSQESVVTRIDTRWTSGRYGVNQSGCTAKCPETAIARGHKPAHVRWVDVTKGDENKYIVRCRVACKELKSQTKEVCFAHELFSALLPWATVKSLLSFLVTDGVSDPEEQLEVGIFDMSRAHFMPKADRIARRASGRCQGTRRW